MNALRTLATLLNQGIDLVAECAGMSEEALLELGLRESLAENLAATAHAYFGQTAFPGRQRRAVAAMRRRRHDLATILDIEMFAARAKTETHRWQLREELADTPAHQIGKVARARLRVLYPRKKPEDGVKVIRRAGEKWTARITGDSAIIADFVGALDADEPISSLDALLNQPHPSYRSLGDSPCGDSSLPHAGVHGDCRIPTAVPTNGSAVPLGDENADQSAPMAMSGASTAAPAAAQASATLPAGPGIPLTRPTLATNIIITLDQLDQIINGCTECRPSSDTHGRDTHGPENSGCENSGCDWPAEADTFETENTVGGSERFGSDTLGKTADGTATDDNGTACSCDVRLRLTNGAEMTGRQLVERRLASIGLVTLVHPEHGPINLYRTQRFANDKQRAMLKAENPVCAWPECNRPADECQFHHIHSWDSGGETNIDNLVPLCAYHNAVNDDLHCDPERFGGSSPFGRPLGEYPLGEYPLGETAQGPPSEKLKRGRMLRINGRTAWQPPWAGPVRFTSPTV